MKWFLLAFCCHATLLLAEDLTISVPADAHLCVGYKTAHFVTHTPLQPLSVVAADGTARYTYDLADGQTYSYRVWRPGSLTHAGFFKMSASDDKKPQIVITEADMCEASPRYQNHDVTNNRRYNVADILVGINAEGHLRMAVGDTLDAFATRTWQVVTDVISNNFVEPDFRYTILDLEGQEDASVVTVQQTPGDAWATLRAVGPGTAIVLVSYDALSASQYNGPTRSDMLGGHLWSALWPENTAAYVVSVGQEMPSLVTGMTLNAGRNATTEKLAGDAVDAELDVFYYPADSAGYRYTFRPEGVSQITMARPVIGPDGVRYTGFGHEGITAHADGSYTVLLRQGRQIVCLADAQGRTAYQVLTAKAVTCNIRHAEGQNCSVLFATLYHPAGKLAGIYNFSAAIDYGELSPGIKAQRATSNQYQFAGTERAQTYSFSLPADWDSIAPMRCAQGTLLVTGYGDPLANHRTVTRTEGRLPNTNAIQHRCYMGALPDIVLPQDTTSSHLVTPATACLPSPDVPAYDLLGRPVRHSRHGLRIVTLPDGTRKVVTYTSE